MTERVKAGALELASRLRPGDRIVCGQACGEPTTLTEALVAQRAELGGVELFIGSAFSRTFAPEQADHIRFRSMGAIGTLGRLAKSQALDIVPLHVGQIWHYIEQGLIGCDVALVQVSPAGPDGRHSFGLTNDHQQMMVRRARTVFAEVNAQVPWTVGDGTLDPADIDVLVESDRAPVELVTGEPGEIDRAIAGHVGRYIEDGSVIQMGIGTVPEAVTKLIADRRDLGVHSGMIGDGVGRLIEAGVVTNARKIRDAGVTVTGALCGTRSLYDLAHRNPAIGMRNSLATHGDAVLTAIPGLVTINSAIEVDLTGQINAEASAGAYLGGTGGQVDYVRGGMRSPGGRSIIALQSVAKGGTISRIVASLSGPVTTARSEADVIVTEHGAAELRGCDLAERARRMIAIAHPAFRDALEEAVRTLAARRW